MLELFYSAGDPTQGRLHDKVLYATIYRKRQSVGNESGGSQHLFPAPYMVRQFGFHSRGYSQPTVDTAEVVVIDSRQPVSMPSHPWVAAVASSPWRT